MVDAMPSDQVYGNPMLAAAPMPYSHARAGSGSGGGGYVPPPPPPPPPSHPPPHIQSPSYYAQPGAGYPAVQYGLQGAPYYGSQGQAVYGQPWPGATSGACVASCLCAAAAHGGSHFVALLSRDTDAARYL